MTPTKAEQLVRDTYSDNPLDPCADPETMKARFEAFVWSGFSTEALILWGNTTP